MAVSISILVSACGSTPKAKIEYPSKQTNQQVVSKAPSQMQVAKSAFGFDDADIQVPAYFDTQGLKYCTFERENEDNRCPLKKPTIRVYFDKNTVQATNEEQQALAAISNQQIELMLENMVAGINRFRIITQDDQTIQQEIEKQLANNAAATAKRLSTKRAINPDYILKVDTLKTADRFYGEYNGVAQYLLEMTASVLDPFTQEKLPSPNIGKIRVESNEVRDHDELVFTEVSGRYYTGFNYQDQQNVQAVVADMASRGLSILVTRLLSELPATGQVMGIKGNQISIDRGQNAGILPKETMIVFAYEAGFVDPIGVAEVNPSKTSANGRIVKWKNSKLAQQILKQSQDGIFRPNANQKIYVVSVGAPKDYVDNRL
ncbi:hypothetical protein DS2_18368 [Catenovulum agarivorans DS-2]|uniref:Uncharacterized protein n=1 Tax=Catenovulum agarivorans DS-2 TaxID=1328313 RepID=W7QS53_9ALTE|nr:hypothetical protein DS2_18368 [Catenovulum agarivorans DS-2]